VGPPTTAAPSFAALADRFETAVASRGLVPHDLQVGGRRVRLHFAGPALVPAVLPAFGHLEVPGDGPDGVHLTVSLWDAESTATPPVPVPPANPDESGPRYHSVADGLVIHVVDEALSALDGNRAVHHFPSATTPRWYQRASPLKELLHSWAATVGLRFVHAAAVGTERGGVLLTGSSGAGKSTTSLACRVGGLGFAGDDYVLVDPDELRVHSVYRTARLGWDTAERFPGLLEADNAPPDEKALGFLDGVVRGFPLRAVLVPAVGDGRRTRVERISPARALLALAPSTVLQIAGGQADALRAARRLLEAVPAYRLDLGTDLDEVADVVAEVAHR
jgi:hypothetical protein